MNEVKLLNIGGIDQNIKDQYARDVIAPSENGLDSSTNLPVSSRHYDEGAYLIAQDRKYYIAITEIDVGDPLVVGTNVRATTVSDEIIALKNQSADTVLEVIADVETSATASKGYSVGRYLYWNYGLSAGMYKVIAEIASSDALVVDTNIEAADKIMNIISGIESKIDTIKYSNPNLLDNPWFTVNQRGFTSANSAGVTVDRWKYIQAAGTVSISDNIISINPTVTGTTLLFGEGIEKDLYKSLLGKTCTLSIMLNDGTIKSKTFNMPSSLAGSARQITNIDLGSTHRFELFEYADGYARVGYYNASNTQLPTGPLLIKAIKLELGSVSTLANDTAPNYQQELAKCQRYFMFYSDLRSSGDITSSAKQYRIAVFTPVPMRIKPSWDFSNSAIMVRTPTGYSNYTGGSNHAVTAGQVNTMSGNCLMLSDNISTSVGDTNNVVTAVQVTNVSLSADL